MSKIFVFRAILSDRKIIILKFGRFLVLIYLPGWDSYLHSINKIYICLLWSSHGGWWSKTLVQIQVAISALQTQV